MAILQKARHAVHHRDLLGQAGPGPTVLPLPFLRGTVYKFLPPAIIWRNLVEYRLEKQSTPEMTWICFVSQDPARDCGFTQWLDEEFPEKATKNINSLLSSEEYLEEWVENLQQELDELRHRYVTGSNGAPRDGQDSNTRPRQVRRLA